jgi:hypothetical protein
MTTAAAGARSPALTAALAYAARGLHVFPCFEITGDDCACPPNHPSRTGAHCGSPGKHPRTKNGVKDATTDVAQITKWWTQWPTANVAIAAGASGLLVVDVDPRNGGDDALHALESRHGRLPDTPRQLTGGGGVHILLRRPERPYVRGPRHGLGRGVDLKADGGYIIAAPSTHLSGRAYVWELGHGLEDVPIALPPPWLLTQLDDRPVRLVATSAIPVTDGLLGAALDAAGWLGRPLGPGKRACRCPREDDHTTGARLNGSSVAFAPHRPGGLGAFYCSHAHCQDLTAEHVLAALPTEAVAVARALWPGAERDDVPPPTDADAPTELLRPARRAVDVRTRADAGDLANLLLTDPVWQGVIAWDEFAQRLFWARPAPPLEPFPRPPVGAVLADAHLTYIAHWAAVHRKWRVGLDNVHAATTIAGQACVIHPPRAYLESLVWDGTPRLAYWLTRYVGAADTEWNAKIAVWSLVAAVARVCEPGCQADYMLILEGPQGAGKSAIVRLLGGPWYRPELPGLANERPGQDLQGSWIIEIAELDAFRGVAVSRIKDFISRTVDVYRPSYGRLSVTRPRQCIFIGTTNEDTYLRDPTGGRRFWPVTVGTLDPKALARDRDQLWAEARGAYAEGVPWWPTSDESAGLHALQDLRFEPDPWEDVVRDFIAPFPHVSTTEILEQAIRKGTDQWQKTDQQRTAEILKRLGWKMKRTGPERTRRWFPPLGLT